MRLSALALLIPFLLAACGEGYVAPHAVIRVEFHQGAELEESTKRVHAALVALGYEFMRHEDRPHPKTGNAQLDNRPDREVSYWQHQRGAFDVLDLHLSVTPFRDASESLCGYDFCTSDISRANPPLRFPFVEYDFAELRPGGFSPAGHAGYAALTKVLERSGGSIVVVKQPPPDDEYVHDRTMRTNLWVSAMSWLLAWPVCMAIFGPLIAFLARALGAAAVWRRAAVVFFGTLLITPLPVATMFVTLYLPAFLTGYEALRAPTIAWGYFVIMFAASAVLNLAAALLFIRDRPFPVLDDRVSRF